MTRFRSPFAAAALAAALLAPGLAAAADPAPAPADPSAATSPKPVEVKVVPPEKKVCKSITRTNSRTDTVRVCLTKAEWDDVRARHRDGMDELLRAHDNPNPPGN